MTETDTIPLEETSKAHESIDSEDLEVIYFNSKTPEWLWLSNFSPHSIADRDRGITYPTAEHWYQGSKADSKKDRDLIIAAKIPALAKHIARKVSMSYKWERDKAAWMKHIIKQKFLQHKDLKEKLVATYPRALVHRTPWDRFWGDGPNGDGRNMLGELLMSIRSDFIDGVSE